VRLVVDSGPRKTVSLELRGLIAGVQVGKVAPRPLGRSDEGEEEEEDDLEAKAQIAEGEICFSSLVLGTTELTKTVELRMSALS
jgi:hypothetical protein